MYNNYCQQEQQQRIEQDMEALNRNIDREEVFYNIGLLDGLRDVKPAPKPWAESSAYREGFLKGLKGHYNDLYCPKDLLEYPSTKNLYDPF